MYLGTNTFSFRWNEGKTHLRLRIINTYFHPQTQHNGLSVNRKTLTETVSGGSGAWDSLRLGGGVSLGGLLGLEEPLRWENLTLSLWLKPGRAFCAPRDQPLVTQPGGFTKTLLRAGLTPLCKALAPASLSPHLWGGMRILGVIAGGHVYSHPDAGW